MYDLLARENRGKYLGGLDYKSPDFCWLVERAIDTNTDDRISNYEYIRFLVILRSTNCGGWLDELFRVFDGDKDDRINLADLKRMFAAADELKLRPYNQQRADDFLSKVDENGDRRLSCDEFVIGAKADQSIMNDLREIRGILLNRHP